MPIDTAKQALLDRDGQTNSVDDRCVVQLVGNDDVAWFAKRWKDRFVCIPTTRECVRGFDAIKTSDAIFQSFVTVECSAYETHTRSARAIFANAFNRSIDHFWMIRQTEIVVRAKTDNFASASNAHGRIHRTFDCLQVLQLPTLAQ